MEIKRQSILNLLKKSNTYTDLVVSDEVVDVADVTFNLFNS